LAASHRFKEAADLLCQTTDYDISYSVDLYNKGNHFMGAIREAMRANDETLQSKLVQSVRSAVNLAYDVKRNQIVKILEDFDKRYLRLKVVQNTKRLMPS